jgi:subfamily B ATP-binding cassette protein MsbA
MQDMIVTGVTTFGTNSCLLVGMLVLMFWLNWKFALVSLSIAPVLFATVFRYKRRIKVATRKARVSTGLLASLAQETLASIRIVQGLAQEEQQDERFQERSEGHHQAFLEVVRYQARVGPLVDVLAAMGLAYVFSKASVGAERIAEVMSIRSEVTDRKGARHVSGLNGGIEFRDVSFEYEAGRPALSHINLAIAPGEKVAIVGATGAGKSTLVCLLPRFYDPTHGEVRIDGEDIRNYSLQSLRDQISLVLQDSLLFSGTIRENIAFGSPNATDEAIVAAAATANADEFIERLPEGYETLVTERGSSLSGGQKQRIAIARAILRDAPILILDEPTSGLDAAAEQTVVDALDRAAAGRTTLIIAHRLTTVRLADRIIVVDRGRIIEEGTHAELLTRGGRYARLYHLQMATETEDTFVPADNSPVVEEADYN